MFGTVASFFRLMRAGLALARHDALLPKEYQDKLPVGARFVGRVSRVFPRRGGEANPGARFARALEKLGPAHVKLGQFLATRSDVVGEEFAQGLGTLRDKLAPFSQDKAEAEVAASLGQPAEALFCDFGPAVAAASVAQVHKATTPDGRTVAVKVLRPGVEDAIARDVRAFRLGASLIERLVPAAKRMEPRLFVETLGRSLALEMDLRMEAASASEMGDVAKTIDGFSTPEVDWARSGRRVLTLSWADGTPLSDETALEAAGVDRVRLAVTAIRAFLVGALDHGVFHADMHEGNLFAGANGDLIAVDFGIIGRVGPNERRYLAEILYGFLRRDYPRIAEVHFEAGYVPRTHTVADFAAALRSVGEPIFGRKADEVSMARVLLQLFDVTDMFDMHLRAELVLLQKTMVQAEGVARRLDPAFDMWEAARPVVERWMRRELGVEGRVRALADELGELAAAARRLPETLDRLAASSDAARGDGVRLDDDTVARLASRSRAEGRSGALLTVLGLALAGALGAGVAMALGG